jgi:hypothetical protein
MSAMTNDPFTLARYAGFYKAIQSAVSIASHSNSAVSLTVFLAGLSRKLRDGCCGNAIPKRNCQRTLLLHLFARHLLVKTDIAWKLDPYACVLPFGIPCCTPDQGDEL